MFHAHTPKRLVNTGSYRPRSLSLLFVLGFAIGILGSILWHMIVG